MNSFDIYNAIREFITLPYKINEYISEEHFIHEWQKVFNSPEAKKEKEVVYLWRSEVSIPRLKGKSDIIYIGQTENSISERHYGKSKIEAKDPDNKIRNEYILRNYGAISFHVAPYSKFGDNLGVAETNLFTSYFCHHLESPPLNKTGRLDLALLTQILQLNYE